MRVINLCEHFRVVEAQFREKKMVDEEKNCFDFETYHEGENKVLKIYLEKCNFPPSLEYSELCMGKVIELLLQNSGVTTLILSQQREYEYDYPQVKLLIELMMLHRKLNKDERFVHAQIVVDPEHERYIRSGYTQFQGIISKKFKED